MRTVRTVPLPRGGETLMLLTSAGLASSSASVTLPRVTGWLAATSAARPAVRASLSSGSVMWKSRRAWFGVMEQPSTGMGTR